MAKRPTRPRDPNQLAKLIVDVALGEKARDWPMEPDTPGLTARRKGGIKGGRARAKKLSSQKRKEIARRAAKARWSK